LELSSATRKRDNSPMSAHGSQADWVQELPPQLFKYVSLEGDRAKWVRNLIVESELFFARPSMFNDPLDCKTPPVFDGREEDVKGYWRERWERTGKGYEEELEWFVEMTKTDEGRRQLTKKYLDLLDTYGIACFAPRPDNFLMWSYYASSHTGIAVRFNTAPAFISQLPEPWMPLKVEYATEFPRPSFYDTDRHRVGRASFGTKALAWAHEEEWRFVRIGKWGAITLPAGMIDGVVLGLKTSPEVSVNVRQWASRANRPIEVLKVVNQPNSFALDVMPLER
jgi:hypothetical protein